jgi:predicted phosphoribosyltransferase
LVLALPRGGVPVGYEVAVALRAPLDVVVARKIGAPGRPELGVGAIAEGGGRVIDQRTVELLGISASDLEQLEAVARAELDEQLARLRHGGSFPAVADRTVVLVDDGLATGVTAEAATLSIRATHPSRVVLAVPVCAPDTAARLRGVADEVVCVHAPSSFTAVGSWYDDFTQTTDDEVQRLLFTANER